MHVLLDIMKSLNNHKMLLVLFEFKLHLFFKRYLFEEMKNKLILKQLKKI